MRNGVPLVHVIGPTYGLEKIFEYYGFKAVIDGDKFDQEELDLACWTGGVDIDPAIYGAKPDQRTQTPNIHRDKREIDFWNKYSTLAKVGICRGAQLINALNGGSMIQHVDNHCGGPHWVDTLDGKTEVTSSVHHQMMIPSERAKLLAWTTKRAFKDERKEPEVLWIKDDRALLFQGHPEFGPKACTHYFYRLLDEYVRPQL